MPIIAIQIVANSMDINNPITTTATTVPSIMVVSATIKFAKSNFEMNSNRLVD